MWQPDPSFDAPSYPKGGIAPSSYDLALFSYVQKARARFNYLQKARQKARARWRHWRDRTAKHWLATACVDPWERGS